MGSSAFEEAEGNHGRACDATPSPRRVAGTREIDRAVRRDRLEAHAPASAPERGEGDDLAALAREIRDALLRIEAGLKPRD